MATDNILRTYGDVSRVEDVVLNAIETLTAEEDKIQKLLGTSVAKDMVHSYLVDTLRTAGSNAVSEGGDYSVSSSSTPTRLTNLVQIINITFSVTRSQSDIQHYHGMSEKERQTMKTIKDWSNSFEYDLVRGTLTSGASGTAATMSGIIEATSKSTNHTSHTSGTAFAASILSGLMRANYDNSNDDVATDLFVGSKLRATIDTFTQKTNVVVNAPMPMSRISKTVSTYDTAFGFLNIHTHRYIQQSGDATGRVLAIRPDKLKIAWLKKPYLDSGLSRAGDYDKLAITGKLTLEVHNQDSNWFSDGFNID